MGVYRRPDSKYWWLRLETAPPGQQRRATKFLIGATATDQRESYASALRAYHTRMLELGQKAEGIAVTRAPLFSVFAKWYDDHVIPQHKGHERERQILPRLVAGFGHLPLDEITGDVVIPWRTERLQSPVTVEHIGGKRGERHTYPKPGPRTVNREVDFLQQILAEAVRVKQIKISPLVGLRNLPAAPIRRRTMTPDEEARLLKTLHPWDKAIFLIGLDALVRLGNILDLRRADDLGTDLQIRDSKNGTAYKVPVSTRLREALDAVPVVDTHKEWYFPQRRGGKNARNRTRAFRKALGWACERADPPVPYGKANDGITFHWGTRRTGATRMIRRGGEKVLGVVQQIGNWKDVSVLVGIYQETITEDMRKAVESVSAPPPFTSPSRPKRKTGKRRLKSKQ